MAKLNIFKNTPKKEKPLKEVKIETTVISETEPVFIPPVVLDTDENSEYVNLTDIEDVPMSQFTVLDYNLFDSNEYVNLIELAKNNKILSSIPLDKLDKNDMIAVIGFLVKHGYELEHKISTLSMSTTVPLKPVESSKPMNTINPTKFNDYKSW